MSHNSSAGDEQAPTLAAGSHTCLNPASYEKKHFVQKGKRGWWITGITTIIPVVPRIQGWGNPRGTCFVNVSQRSLNAGFCGYRKRHDDLNRPLLNRPSLNSYPIKCFICFISEQRLLCLLVLSYSSWNSRQYNHPDSSSNPSSRPKEGRNNLWS